MQRHQKRLTRWIATLVVASLALVGCGTEEAVTMSKNKDTVIDGTGERSADSTISGAFRTAASNSAGATSGRLAVTIDASDLPPEARNAMDNMTMSGEFSGTTSRLVMSIAGTEIEITCTPGVIYERLPTIGWVRIANNGEAAANATGGLGGDFMSTLKQIGLSDADVTDAGSDEIDGQAFHRYSATLDFTKIVDKGLDATGASDTTREMISSTFGAMSGIPVELWIDDATQLVRRMSMTIAFMGISIIETIDITNYGEPVAIEIPTDATEMTIDELTALGAGLGGGTGGRTTTTTTTTMSNDGAASN